MKSFALILLIAGCIDCKITSPSLGIVTSSRDGGRKIQTSSRTTGQSNVFAVPTIKMKSEKKSTTKSKSTKSDKGKKSIKKKSLKAREESSKKSWEEPSKKYLTEPSKGDMEDESLKSHKSEKKHSKKSLHKSGTVTNTPTLIVSNPMIDFPSNSLSANTGKNNVFAVPTIKLKSEKKSSTNSKSTKSDKGKQSIKKKSLKARKESLKKSWEEPSKKSLTDPSKGEMEDESLKSHKSGKKHSKKSSHKSSTVVSNPKRDFPSDSPSNSPSNSPSTNSTRVGGIENGSVSYCDDITPEEQDEAQFKIDFSYALLTTQGSSMEEILPSLERTVHVDLLKSILDCDTSRRYLQGPRGNRALVQERVIGLSSNPPDRVNDLVSCDEKDSEEATLKNSVCAVIDGSISLILETKSSISQSSQDRTSHTVEAFTLIENGMQNDSYIGAHENITGVLWHGASYTSEDTSSSSIGTGNDEVSPGGTVKDDNSTNHTSITVDKVLKPTTSIDVDFNPTGDTEVGSRPAGDTGDDEKQLGAAMNGDDVSLNNTLKPVVAIAIGASLVSVIIGAYIFHKRNRRDHTKYRNIDKRNFISKNELSESITETKKGSFGNIESSTDYESSIHPSETSHTNSFISMDMNPIYLDYSEGIIVSDDELQGSPFEILHKSGPMANGPIDSLEGVQFDYDRLQFCKRPRYMAGNQTNLSLELRCTVEEEARGEVDNEAIDEGIEIKLNASHELGNTLRKISRKSVQICDTMRL